MYGAVIEMPSTGSPLELVSTTSSCKPVNSAAKPTGPSYLLLIVTENRHLRNTIHLVSLCENYSLVRRMQRQFLQC